MRKMGKGATILSHAEKLALVQSVKRKPTMFVDPPKRGRTVEVIEWENAFDLATFKRNPGRDGEILDMVEGTDYEDSLRKSNALARSIAKRLTTATAEKWTVTVHDDAIWLRFASSNGK